MSTENKKTLKITLTTTSDNTFNIEVYEPESGESRIIKCSDNGDLTELNEEIMSWVSIMRDEAEEMEEDKLIYPELEGIDLIIYYSNARNKWCATGMSDKEQKDDHGYPWYEGAYGNCLIALNNQKITDKLYLYDTEAAKKVYSCLFTAARYITNNERKEIFEKYATRIIERKG